MSIIIGMITNSKTRITRTVGKERVPAAAQAFHAAFRLDEPQL